MRFPIGRCTRLTFILRSGVRIVQDVETYDIRYGAGDIVTATSYTWAKYRQLAVLIRADQIAAVLKEKGPYYWRGFKA